MRDFEVGLVDDFVAVKKDVEVDFAGGVFFSGFAVATHFVFDFVEADEEFGRAEVGVDFDDGVEKVWLGFVGFGFGFEDGGGFCDFGEGGDFVDGGFDVFAAVAEVCAESYVDCFSFLHKCSGSRRFR